MGKPTYDVFESVLAWAGYGLAYSERETGPPQTQRVKEAVPAERSSVKTNLPAVPSETRPSDEGLPWTDLFAGSTARRLQAWHQHEEVMVDRWDLWKARRLRSMARRRQTWTNEVHAYLEDFRAMTDRTRARWDELRRFWHSRRGSMMTPTVSSGIPQTGTDHGQPAVQRDRVSKVLRRVALDTSPQAADNTEPTVDESASEIFSDPWAIDDPTADDTPVGQENATAPVSSPVVERLQHMLER